jgi:hypothetical protein
MHNEELHNLCVSPNITRVIKSRRMRWAGHTACMEEVRNDTKSLSEQLKGMDYLDDLGVAGRVILE